MGFVGRWWKMAVTKASFAKDESRGRERNKDKGKGGRKGGGKPAGKQAGDGEPVPYAVPSSQEPPVPWATESTRTLPPPMPIAAASSASDSKLEEILSSLKGAFSSAPPPPAVAEIISRMENDNGKALTKRLHGSTKQLGAAKKELAQLRQARSSHSSSWRDFVLQATVAIEKGQALYEQRQTEFAEKERIATEKVAAARQELKTLTSQSAETAEDSRAEEIQDDDSEVEMLPVSATAEEAQTAVQAQKKLRTALQSVCARLPSAEDDTTPKHRAAVKAEPPQ